MPENHALVFGASGISGWAVVNALLHAYPNEDSFSHVTALTNRPLDMKTSQWPCSTKLQLVSGIDLLTNKGQEGLEQEMSSKIDSINTVSHVFFFAYIFDADPAKEISTNVMLLERAVSAVDHLSKSLKFVLLPTGTKAYGVQCLADFPFSNDLPLRESLPRIPEPYASRNFYYNQTDFLEEASKGRQWTWCEVRPDVVCGFVPQNNVYCLAQTLATYLSCYVAVEGKGSECAFPGTEKSWTIFSNDSGQDILAKFSIHAALHPETCGNGQAFNVADNSKPSSWSIKWPIICEYFGLVGAPPPPGGSGPQPGQYLQDHLERWKEIEKQYSLQPGRVGNDRSLATFQYFIMTMFDFSRHMDLSRMHSAWAEGGQVEERGAESWCTAFDRFRKANIIP